MREVEVRFISNGDTHTDSFFAQLDKLCTSKRHHVSSTKERGIEDGRTVMHITFNSDAPVEKIKEVLGKSTVEPIRVYCPNRQSNPNNSGKRRARRVRGRKKAG